MIKEKEYIGLIITFSLVRIKKGMKNVKVRVDSKWKEL